jgi:hypothetical protein
MAKTRWVLSAALLACGWSSAGAQIGKLPLLDSLPRVGECTNVTVSAALKHDGVARMIQFSSKLPVRIILVGIDGRGRPMNLMALTNRPLTSTKGEGESINAAFGDLGSVVRGARSYMTSGTPASRSEDRRGTLFATDTLQIKKLARAVLSRCGG